MPATPFDRVVHAPPIGLERTVLFIKAPRLECRRCNQVLNAVLPNVVPLCNYTKSLARLVIDLRKMMTINDVARYIGVSDTMIRSIDKKYLQKTFCKPRLRRKCSQRFGRGKSDRGLGSNVGWTFLSFAWPGSRT